ncbi:MAG: glycosyltransferase family 39 protein [Elusimicrobiota bacterium]
MKKKSPRAAPPAPADDAKTRLLAAALVAWAAVVYWNYFQAYPFPGFPFFRFFELPEPFRADARFLRALGRHAARLAAAGLFLFSCWGWGRAVFRDRRPSEGSGLERLLFETAAGAVVWVFLLMALGFSGFLRPSVLQAWTAAGAVWGAAAWLRIRRGPSVSAPAAPPFSLGEKIPAAALAVCLALGLLGALVPETAFDAMHYYLSLPAHWLRRGRIAADPHLLQSYFPHNFSLLFIPPMAVGGVGSARLVHLAFGALSTLAVYAFVRGWAGRFAALAAAALFASTPSGLMVAWRGTSELGQAFFEIMAVYALFRRQGGEEGARRDVLWAGVFAGVGLGIKYTSLASAPLLALLAFLRRGAGGRRAGAQDALLLLTVAALAASPWYIRNWMEAGNPVYPFLSGVFGGQTIGHAGNVGTDPAPIPDTWGNYLLFPWKVTMGTLAQEGFSGPLWLILLPLLFVRSPAGPHLRFAGVYLAGAAAFWHGFSHLYLRYFLHVLPVLAAALALRAEARPAWFRSLFIWILLPGLASNIAFSMLILKTNKDPLPVLAGQRTEDAYLSTLRLSYPFPYHPAAAWANENLPPEAKVLFVGETRSLYLERDAVWNDVSDHNTLVALCRQARDAEDLRRLFRQRGVTHILINYPELARVKGYDVLNWEGPDLAVFLKFWRSYIREAYAGAAAVPGLSADRRRAYEESPFNAVFLYEILDAPQGPDRAPPPLWLHESLYPPARRPAVDAVQG